ncbi:MAG: hypothetical protein AAB323_01575 [Pseudomonadota bacterium]
MDQVKKIMSSLWGIIYCYLVLFITTCSMLVTSCVLISNAYDLYYPPKFEDQIVKTEFYVQSKNKNFAWDAPANKNVKDYAVKRYERKNGLVKNSLYMIFFMLISMGHILILRRFKKER